MSRALQLDHSSDHLRYVNRLGHLGLAVGASVLLLSAACGGKKEGPVMGKGTGTVKTPEVATTVPGTDSSTGDVVRDSGNVTTVSFRDAELAFSEKRYGDAVQLYSSYVDLRPDSPWGHFMLGLSLWKSGDPVAAESALRRTLEIDPKNVKGLLNLARVLLEQGKARDARQPVMTAIKLDSTSGEGYRLMGRVRSEMNMPVEALAAYRVALQKDPLDAWSMNNMGMILVQQRKFEEALGPLARAVQVDSTVAVFHNNLGIALEHTGQFVLATKSYRSAITLDSRNTKAVMSIARVEGRKEDPSLVAVDLGQLAERFDKDVRSTQVSTRPPEK